MKKITPLGLFFYSASHPWEHPGRIQIAPPADCDNSRPPPADCYNKRPEHWATKPGKDW